MNDNTDTLTYGNISVPVESLPKATLLALMQRGFSHVLGNEVASKVTAFKKTDEGKTASDEEIAALTEEHRKAFLSKMEEGKLGVRVGGPRGTALETVIREIAVERLKANFATKDIPWPKKASDTVNVGGKTMTRSELVEAYSKSEKNAESLKEEAQRRMASVEADEEADDLEDLI